MQKKSLIILSATLVLFACSRGELFQNNSNISLSINTVVTDSIGGQWLGFGYNQYPIDRDASGKDLDYWDSAHWLLTTGRMNYIRPSIVRLNVYREWFDSSGVVGDYNWDSPRILSLCRLLDWYRANEIPVMTGLWHSNKAGEDDPSFYISTGPGSFQALQADLFNYLYQVKGYTNIRWYTPTNEPLGAGISFSQWSAMMHNTYLAFMDGNFPLSTLCGPDSWGDWNGMAASENAGDLHGYDHHYYAAYDEITSGSLEINLKAAVSAIQSADSSNKPVFVSECGFLHDASDPIDYWYLQNPVPVINPGTFLYGLLAFDYGIQLARSGNSGAMAWALDGFDCRKDPGMWNISGMNNGTVLRPWFYTWSLLCRYFPAGGTIYPVKSYHDQVRIVAFRKPSGKSSHWTIAMVNWAGGDANISIYLPGWKGGSFTAFTYSKLNSGDGYSLGLAGQPMPISSPSTGFTLKLPSQTAMLITTLDNAPLDPQ